ncbi:hypothetical protein WDU94_013463 [Cyamophila willieti]
MNPKDYSYCGCQTDQNELFAVENDLAEVSAAFPPFHFSVRFQSSYTSRTVPYFKPTSLAYQDLYHSGLPSIHKVFSNPYPQN